MLAVLSIHQNEGERCRRSEQKNHERRQGQTPRPSLLRDRRMPFRNRGASLELAKLKFDVMRGLESLVRILGEANRDQ